MILPYRSFNSQLQNIFGERVQKIPLDAGLVCPNKSGQISDKGCIFCDPYGSGHIPHKGLPIDEQISSFIKNRKEKRFIAYLQANCNTNAGIDTLESLFQECISKDGVCGLMVGTRPDCLPVEVLDVLAVFARKTFLVVELGLQSSHDQSLSWLNRNHDYGQFLQAYEALKKRDIRTVVHLIVGIPGEGQTEYRQTVLRLNDLRPWGIKFHVLHVLKGTELQRRYEAGKIELMSRDDYIVTVTDMIEWMHPSIGVHRLSADRDAVLFIAPQWAIQKTTVINVLNQQMLTLNQWQGKALGYPRLACQED